jgi:hypothetical protein
VVAAAGALLRDSLFMRRPGATTGRCARRCMLGDASWRLCMAWSDCIVAMGPVATQHHDLLFPPVFEMKSVGRGWLCGRRRAPHPLVRTR